jgi:hypothetical protein
MSAVGVSSRGALCKLCGVSRGLGLTPAPRQPERGLRSRRRSVLGALVHHRTARLEIGLANADSPRPHSASACGVGALAWATKASRSAWLMRQAVP